MIVTCYTCHESWEQSSAGPVHNHVCGERDWWLQQRLAQIEERLRTLEATALRDRLNGDEVKP